MKYFQLLSKKSNLVSSTTSFFLSDCNHKSHVDIQISFHVLKKKRDCKTSREMWKCKTKAIQADLDISTHIPAYSGLFRHIQT